MQSEQQQRIMGYFIEEAKDHLNTIEQGLLNLQGTIEDPDLVSEVFRAAHSVKGGAAMLGLDSIQKTAHRLEDYFKVLKECPIRVDQKLESLFLRVFDTLQDLLEQLQGPFGLTDDNAAQIMGDLEPVLVDLNTHLNSLVEQSGATPPDEVDLTRQAAQVASPAPQPIKLSETVRSEDSALLLYFQSDVPAQLRTMLQLFKQPDTAQTRQQLQAICNELAHAGESFDLPPTWSNLATLAQRAIANPDNDFRSLAPALIKDIKKAQDLVLSGQAIDIEPSPALQELQPITAVLEDEAPVLAAGELVDDMADLLDFGDDFAHEPVMGSASMSFEDAFADLDDLNAASAAGSQDDTNIFEFDDEPAESSSALDDDFFAALTDDDSNVTVADQSLDIDTNAFDAEFSTLDEDSAETVSPRQGPQVGAAELNSLADLFENEASGLDIDWQEEVIDDSSDLLVDGLALDASNDFSDLLFDDRDPDTSDQPDNDDDDISALLTRVESDRPSDSAATVIQDEEFADLFEVGSSPETGSPHSSSTSSSSELDNLGAFFSGMDDEDSGFDNPSSLDDKFLDDEFRLPSPEELASGQDSLTASAARDIDTDGDFWDTAFSSETDLSVDPMLNDQSPAMVSPEDQPDNPLSEERTDKPTDEPDEWGLEQSFDSLLFTDDDSANGLDDSDLGAALDNLLGAKDTTLDDVQHGDSDSDANSVDFSEDLFDGSLEEPPLDAGVEPSPGVVASIDADAAELSLDLFSLGSDAFDNHSDSLEELSEPGETVSSGTAPIGTAPIGTDTGESLEDVLDLFAEQDGSEQDDIDALFADDDGLVGEDNLSADITEELPEGWLNELSEELSGSESVTSFVADVTTEPDEEALDALTGSGDFAIDGDLDQIEIEDMVPLSEEEGEFIVLESDDYAHDDDGLDVQLFDSQPEPQDNELELGDSASEASVVEQALASLEENDANLNEFERDAEFSFESSLGDEFDSEDSGDRPIDNITDSFASSSAESISFNDLNTLDHLDSHLDDDPYLDSANSEPVTTPDTISDVTSDVNSFDDLEAFLSQGDHPEESDTLPSMPDLDGSVSSENSFNDLEALLDTPLESSFDSGFDAGGIEVRLDRPDLTLMAEEDDFSDLEKLLEEADHQLGGSPTAKAARGPSQAPNRRSTARRSTSSLSDQNMRVSVKNLDNLNNLVGELVVNRNSLEQSQERLRQFLDNLLYQVQQLSDVGQRMRDLYERSLLESSLLSSRRTHQLANQTAGSVAIASDATHATGESFDALEMDRFTGFHTLSQEMIELIVRVREAASDIDFVIDESDQTTRMFRQVTTQLQEGLTRSRMVPFAQAASRLPRAVRDISIKCGKQAELIVEGKDTLIDKMILEQLYDPMTHLVNNAITHGIETPHERQALNKPPVGKITIRVFHQGNQTIISVTDDGAGIDPDKVKSKALQRGLISPEEARTMSRLDVYDLLFHHGFSTRDQADDFAGRGVGMDVVRTSLNEIRGVINIDSTVGQGTTFTIRLPLTLSISKALLCVSNRARIAFPMDGVEDMLDVPRDRVQTDEEGRSCILWRDIMLPFRPLDELLKYNRIMGRGSVYGGNQEEDVISVVVLRSAGNYLALQVDQVLGEQEIVIKQLEAPIPKPAGIAGATVLGDGRIMPIADVLELIDLSMGRIRREAGSSLWEQEAARIASTEAIDTKTEPTVLIVDDSITVRELLSMTFNKVGYRVEQARDGQEAWEKLKSGLPCELVFCDIEMPRMDGLELLSRLQKDPNLKHLPIAMLTSRGADRHRQMAVQLGAKGYFTKPYLEEALLDAAQRMLNGEVLVGNN